LQLEVDGNHLVVDDLEKKFQVGVIKPPEAAGGGGGGRSRGWKRTMAAVGETENVGKGDFLVGHMRIGDMGAAGLAHDGNPSSKWAGQNGEERELVFFIYLLIL
jgi:hypothetical protein